MGLLVGCELLLSGIQMWSILGTSDVPWPDEWIQICNYISLSIIDFNKITIWFKVPNDFRTEFTVVATGIPLLLTFVVLMFCQDLPMILWFFFTLFSAASLVTGIASLALNVSAFNALTVGWYLLGGGIFGICISLSIWMIRRFNRQGKLRSFKSVAIFRSEEAARFPVLRLARQAVTVIALAIGACCLLGWFPFVTISEVPVIGSFAVVIGWILLALAIFCFIYFITTLTEKGRLFEIKLKKFIVLNFMKMFIILVTATYIPVFSTVLGVFNCEYVTCESGRRYPDDHGSLVRQNIVSLKKCESCNFFDAFYLSTPQSSFLFESLNSTYVSQCPSRLRASLCPSVSQFRLAENYSIHCYDISKFYWVSSFIIFFSFLVGVPLMFMNLIKEASKITMTEFPDPPGVTATEEQLWSYKIVESKAVTKNLYLPFRYKIKHWRVAILLYKGVIILSSSLILRIDTAFGTQSAVAFSLMGATHLVFLLLSLKYKPYINKAEDRISAAISGVMFVNCIVAVLLIRKVFSAKHTVVFIFLMILLAIDLFVPLLAVILSLLLLRDRRSDLYEHETASKYSEDLKALVEKEGWAIQRRMEKEEQAGNAAPILCQPMPDSPSLERLKSQSPTSAESPGNPPNTVRVTEEEEAPLSEDMNCAAHEQQKRAAMLIEEQKSCDEKLNAKLVKRLTAVFAVIGFCSFVALVFCVVGMLYASGHLKYYPSDPIDTSTRTALATYETWGTFIENCCCMDVSDASANLRVYTPAISVNSSSSAVIEFAKGRYNYSIEKWVCANGVAVERTRLAKDAGQVRQGYGIRPFCSKQFALNCSLVSVNGLFKASCSNGTFGKFELENLW